MGRTTIAASSVLGKAGMQVETEVRGFKVLADEPREFGGTDQGMSPVEMLLAALGSCQCMSTRFFAGLLGIELAECRVALEGDFDMMGFLDGNSGIRPGLQEIRVTVHIQANAPAEKVAELMSLVESRCPVGDTVLKGVPVVVRHVVA